MYRLVKTKKMGDDDTTPPGDLLPSGALFIVPGRFSNSEKKLIPISTFGSPSSRLLKGPPKGPVSYGPTAKAEK